MIVLDLEQGSPAWVQARLGLPTASRFGSILTPAKLEYSKGASAYVAELLSEWATGLPCDESDSQWMQRGTMMEEEARRWYSMQNDVEVQRVGLVLRDDRRVGGSPDGLVGEDGGIEIKVPSLKVHMEYLMGAPFPYVPQMQGLMYLTGRAWWDFLSFNPVLPKVCIRIPRDAEYAAKLDKALTRFLREMDDGKRKLLELGLRGVPEDQLPPPAAKSPEEVVAGMYGPPPAPVTEEQRLRLSVLMGQAGEMATDDDRLNVHKTLNDDDGQMADVWIKTLERRIREVASVVQESLI